MTDSRTVESGWSVSSTTHSIYANFVMFRGVLPVMWMELELNRRGWWAL